MKIALLAAACTFFISGCASIKLSSSPDDSSACSGGEQASIDDYFSKTGWDSKDKNKIFQTEKLKPLKTILNGNIVPFSGPSAWNNASGGATGIKSYPAELPELLKALEINDLSDTRDRSVMNVKSLSEMENKSGKKLEAALSSLTPKLYKFQDAPESMEISAKDDTIKTISEAIQADGAEGLYKMTLYQLQVAGAEFLTSDISNIDTKTILLAQRIVDHENAKFLRTYLNAYFRAGKWFQASLNTASFSDEAASILKKAVNGKVDSATQADIVKKLTEKLNLLCKSKESDACLLTSGLGKTALITRNGSSIQFKGVALGIDYDGHVETSWDYPKSVEFAPQLVRVFVEALYDARRPRIPAVDNSTACTAPSNGSPALYDGLSCLTKSTIDAYPFLKDAVASTDEKASKADGLTGAGAGLLIRSFWVAALNNETASKSVENLAAVIAKKQTERYAWGRVKKTYCTRDAKTPAAWTVDKS